MILKVCKSISITFIGALVLVSCSGPVSNSTDSPTVEPVPTPTHVQTESPTSTPEITPTHPPMLLFRYARAVRLLEVGAPEEAIPQFTLVIRMLPDFAQGYYGRALAYSENEQPDLALQDYDMAIKLKPDLAEAYKDRAMLYIDMGKRTKAVIDLEIALSLFNNVHDADEMDEVKSLLETLR